LASSTAAADLAALVLVLGVVIRKITTASHRTN
jgi:hypothetical protein